MVHGDTLTALLATVVARIRRIEVIHVEAGLRSGSWRNPFPEELCRRFIGKLARVHFAPTLEAVNHLKGCDGDVVYTHGNTSRDALVQALRRDKPQLRNNRPFGIVTLHRSELLSNLNILEETLRELAVLSDRITVRLVLDERSASIIYGSSKLLNALGHNVKIEDKLNHNEFVEALVEAEFVVTDSGGIQEEAAILGKPCLVHRKMSERQDGIGANARLSGWVEGSIIRFGSYYEELKSPQLIEQASPSAIILRELRKRAYVAGT
jgi:UDP-N-acetylglucosamine 2-epimerase (non-hydrolysing)